MNGNDIKQSAAKNSVMVYASYLLRYVSTPITAGELQKMAARKHFMRIANYFGELPADKVFKKREDILSVLKKQTRG